LLRAIVSVLFALACSAAFASAGLAATPGAQQDQTVAGTSTGSSLFSDFHGIWVAQSFTAGVSGSLTDVRLNLTEQTAFTAPTAIEVDLVPLTGGGLPDPSTTLATASLAAGTATSTAADYDLTFSSPYTITAGTQYGLVIHDVPGAHVHYVIPRYAQSAYAGGDGYSCSFSCGSASSWSSAGVDLGFTTFVIPSAMGPLVAHPSRAGYCAAAGNLGDAGLPVPAGTFLNLEYGQPDNDARYAGAVPAIYVAGSGITCDPPPPGYLRIGYASESLGVPADTYAEYAR
jgi:hypothetical protein